MNFESELLVMLAENHATIAAKNQQIATLAEKVESLEAEKTELIDQLAKQEDMSR